MFHSEIMLTDGVPLLNGIKNLRKQVTSHVRKFPLAGFRKSIKVLIIKVLNKPHIEMQQGTLVEPRAIL